jgi:hypothetical protein
MSIPFLLDENPGFAPAGSGIGNDGTHWRTGTGDDAIDQVGGRFSVLTRQAPLSLRC